MRHAEGKTHQRHTLYNEAATADAGHLTRAQRNCLPDFDDAQFGL